jgi:hypothetical protein
MIENSFIKEIISFSNSISNRLEFHEASKSLLIEMSRDKKFWNELFKYNLSDKGFLNREWSMYDIPFFYVYENDDFYIKVHLFVPLKNYESKIAASAIHHHNNYLITTYAAFGSGYETLLFEKDININPITKEVNLKVREHFSQQERHIHTVDAWEPHVVINPTSLSATLVIWSPDKKRATDSLRSNPLLKAFKMPLRKLIYAIGIDKKIGIAAKETYQFYPKDGKFYAVPEDDFFAPTRAQKGQEVNDYSVQTLFAFMQRMNFNDVEFLKSMKQNKDVPLYYYKWIDMLLNNQTIPDTYAKEIINVPGGKITVDDILFANKMTNNIIE